MKIFSHLTDFGYKRNWKEAIGFYLAYLVLTMIIGGLVAGLSSTFFFSETDDFAQGYEYGVKVGTWVAVIVSLLLVGVILQKKNLLRGFGYILLLLLSGILAFFAGGLVGLIPIAYLTTKPGGQSSAPKVPTLR